MSSAEKQEARKRGGRWRRTDLPEDLMVEILLKLPVRSLLRFKCVCKRWYNLILSPNFIAVHSMNNHQHNHMNEIPLSYHACSGSPATTTMSLRINNTPVDITIPIEASKLVIMGCSNGVVCLSRPSRPPCYPEFVLWNPATRQYRQIGCSHINGFFSFCFDPIANSFKLADVEFCPWTNNIHMWNSVQVNLFRTCDNSWTHKIIDVPYPIFERQPCFVTSIASFKRYMYWNVRSDENRYILCFDLIDELFQRYELPDHGNGSSSLRFAGYKESIVVFAHKLAAPEGFCSSFDVYQLRNDDPNQSWDMILTCEPSVKFTRALGFVKKDNLDFVVLTTSTQHLHFDTQNNYTGSCWLYDPETKKATEFSLKDLELKFFGYSESFASLH